MKRSGIKSRSGEISKARELLSIHKKKALRKLMPTRSLRSIKITSLSLRYFDSGRDDGVDFNGLVLEYFLGISHLDRSDLMKRSGMKSRSGEISKALQLLSLHTTKALRKLMPTRSLHFIKITSLSLRYFDSGRDDWEGFYGLTLE